jgi:CRP/FNR family transcriptional regulator, cyclic AMP receptor protein
MIKTLEPIIRAHPFFQDLADRHIRLIVGCAKNARFDADKVIFREGEEANHFYLIREGLVSVEVVIPSRGTVTVETVNEGEVLGWSWLFPPYRWHFDARTRQPTRALVFDGKCLRAKCEKDHDLGYELLKRFSRVLTERLEATRLQLLDFYGTRP